MKSYERCRKSLTLVMYQGSNGDDWYIINTL